MKLTTTEVNGMIATLASKILASGVEYKQVVGIENGGLNVSIPLAKILNLPHTSVRISHYNGRSRRAWPFISGDPPGTGNLVVDDLIDDGYTLRTYDDVFGLLGNAVAVLFWKAGSIPRPEYYVHEKPNSWVIFPWEIKCE